MTTSNVRFEQQAAPSEVSLAAEAFAFPPLTGGAMPVAQDRAERLVSTTVLPQRPDEVWAALTDPERVANWLAVCRGDWAVAGRESMLDFEDGEFFWCRTGYSAQPAGLVPGTLRYLWRWVGIGPATSVTWTVGATQEGTAVTVVEEAENPPADWRSWNGMGWPGILDQLAAHLRTGTRWRWPWRRMGPYLQIPLPAPAYQAWEALTSPGAIKHWLQRSSGSLAPDDELTLIMGDASGTIRLRITKSVEAAQEFPSYLPYLEFELRRPSWNSALGGRIWIEPAGLGSSLLQVFHHGWENLDIHDPLAERKILTGFWVSAAGRAQQLFHPQGPAAGPHGWSVGAPSADGLAGSNGQGAGASPPPWTPPGMPPADPSASQGMPIPQVPGMPPGPSGMASLAFFGQVMGDLSGAMASILCALGIRLGILAELAGRGPATSSELAEHTGLAERYLREWLHGMTSAGYLTVDRDSGEFTLPPAHAALLAWPGSPLSMAAGYELLLSLAGVVDLVADGFRTGDGIDRDRYPDAFYTAMERMSAGWLDTSLVQQWIPAVEGLTERLAAGGTVVDVGCGGGRALVALATAFEQCRCIGFDTHAPNVARALAAAAQAGVSDRVRVEHADAYHAMPAHAELVTLFDVLHDAAEPVELLRTIRGALDADAGVVLVLESACTEHSADNTGPSATILYATSTLYCVPTALSVGAPALGTLGLPAGQLQRMADAAGYRAVEQIPTGNPFTSLYVLRG